MKATNPANKPSLATVRQVREAYRPGQKGAGLEALSKRFDIPEWLIKDILRKKSKWSKCIDSDAPMAAPETEESIMDRIEAYIRSVPLARAHQITVATGLLRGTCDRHIQLLLIDERIHEVETFKSNGRASPIKSYAAGPTEDLAVIMERIDDVKRSALTDWPRGQHGPDSKALPAAFFVRSA